MVQLILSLLPLLIAPICFPIIAKHRSWLEVLDGFVFVSIGGLILVGILPEVFAHGGWLVFLMFGLGLVLPTVSEKLLQQGANKTHFVALFFGMLGLIFHTMIDGATLASGAEHHIGHNHHHHSGSFLSLGVLLHRIPMGLTVWWFMRPKYGRTAASVVLVMIGMGTIVGYSISHTVIETFSTSGFAYFQALVAGSLMHVAMHRIHVHDDHDHHNCSHDHSHGNRWFEGVGNVLGAVVVTYLIFDHQDSIANTWLSETAHALFDLSLESAPALLLGYFTAGLAIAFMPHSYVRWMSQGNNLKQSLRGILIGLPLPVCSCGVVPLYHTLVKKGAPPVAAMAFLIATPEFGIDALLLSLPLLGGEMTLLRILTAGVVAFIVAIIVGRLTPTLFRPERLSEAENKQAKQDWKSKFVFGMKEGFGSLVDHTGPWIVAGLLIASAFHPLLSENSFSWLPAGLEVPFFALLGMPLYVCASGVTPLIAVFLMSGVSPGAAMAFLLTGPATNISTFGVLAKLHGKKTAFFFGLATFLSTVILGYIINAAFSDFKPLTVIDEHDHGTWFTQTALALLVILFVFTIIRRGARTFVGELFIQGGHDHDHDHGHHHHHDHDHGHHHHHDHSHLNHDHDHHHHH